MLKCLIVSLYAADAYAVLRDMCTVIAYRVQLLLYL